MSHSSLKWDEGAYAQRVRDSSAPSEYVFGTPTQACPPCFPSEPGSTPGRFGYACDNWVDASSDLLGITRKASKDPAQQYKPSGASYCCTGSMDSCAPMSESTRLSNPSCTLRGMGWNRWQWLCEDPQERAIEPFQSMIQNRLVVKDNHRPCLPTPIDPTQALPPLNNDDRVYSELDSFVCGKPSASHVPKVGWKAACEAASA